MFCSFWCRWMKIPFTLHLNPSRNVKLWDWDIWGPAHKFCVQSRNEINYAIKAQCSEEFVWKFTVKAVFSSAISCWFLQLVVLQQITVGVNAYSHAYLHGKFGVCSCTCQKNGVTSWHLWLTAFNILWFRTH